MDELARACDGAVDVVLLHEAPPALAGRVIREGKLLLSRDETARVRFETDALRRDLDTIRLRQQLTSGMLTSTRESQ